MNHPTYRNNQDFMLKLVMLNILAVWLMSLSADVFGKSPSQDPLVIAINAGGEETSYNSIIYHSDRYFIGGNPYSTTDPIQGTSEDTLFQSERYGSYSYEIPVTDGTYGISLHFAEIYHNQDGQRLFNLYVENSLIMTNVSLYALVGHDTAYTFEKSDIPVTDGKLSIRLETLADNATLAGFAIFSADGAIDDSEPEYPQIEATNPIIWADVPDPSLIRVGNTYYMSSTTMHMNPGAPIMKSTDLYNWQTINYAHQSLGNTDGLNLNNGQDAYGSGSWASSIRHVNGIWYVSTFSYSTNRTYIFSTPNIEQGSWNTTAINRVFHDNSLFFENGRAYLIYGVDDIRIIELNSDASGIRPGGLDQLIVPDSSSIAGSSFIVRAEGSHMQKINGWYYLSLICWPSGGMRTQLVYRSRNLTGPYEGRIALQDRGVAQGGFIDTPNGEWYAMLFRDSGAVGRIPYLIPVSWENDWPVLGDGGRVPQYLGFTVEDKGIQGIVESDEFNQATLGINWQWNHNPNAVGWSLSARPGFMRLTNQRTDSSFVRTRNTLTQRAFGPRSAASVAMEIGNMKNGDYAGLGALQKNYGFVGVKQVGSTRSLIMVNASNGRPQELAKIDINQNRVFLKIEMDFQNQIDRARFYYSFDEINWNPIGNSLQMSYTLPHFMGYRYGLFNYGTQLTGGFVDFDYFKVKRLE